MRGWLRVSLAILGLALVITAGAYIFGSYVPPGFSSYLAQSLGIAILSLGIASSTIAVLSGRGIEEYFQRRREEKRIKLALVSYLAGLPLQILAITSIFEGLTGGQSVPGISIRTELDYMVQPHSIDTDYYEKNIKDHLLYLPVHLANQAISVTLLVAMINYNYSSLITDISSNSISLKGPKPVNEVLSAYIESHLKTFHLMFEYGNDCIEAINELRGAILKGGEGTINLDPLTNKISTIRESYQVAGADFYTKLNS